MINLPPRVSDSRMGAQWENLKISARVRDDTQAASGFERGVLHPQLAKELYVLPSKVLMAHARKHIDFVSSVFAPRPWFPFLSIWSNCFHASLQGVGRGVVNRDEGLTTVDFGGDVSLAEKEQMVLLESQVR
ncbi:hypothetical protein BHM03_00036351 [Ensete ventricosum]|nr:hypothetical protein BHM03_00036351 [Ensete ventricosum]